MTDKEWSDLLVDVAKVKENVKSNQHRIDTVEKKVDRIEDLTISVHSLATSVKQMAEEQIEYRENQSELAKRILDIEQAPTKEKAKRHDDTVTYLIHLLISAVVGFMLCYLGIQ